MQAGKFVKVAVAAAALAASSAFASPIVTVAQDVSVYRGVAQSANTSYNWVGRLAYSAFSLFQFDVSAYVGQTVSSISFTAFHNYTYVDGHVGASVSYAGWNRNTVTDAYLGTLGAVLDSETANYANLNQWQTWHLGPQTISGPLLTVALQGMDGWNDYQPLLSGSNAAYLTLASSSVPEPSVFMLSVLGLAVMGVSRRRRAS